MKISVIMASYLGDYPNAASDRRKKFVRAVQSFIDQPYPNKELIIVADGCGSTEKIFHCKISDRIVGFKSPIDNPRNEWDYDTVFQYGRFVMMPKQELFSGNVRNKGLQYATGDIICYLDIDDVFFGNHLGNIVAGFDEKTQWVYYNDFVATTPDLNGKRERGNILSQGRIGTSSIAHRKNLNIQWPDGYEHDWRLIENMIGIYPSHKHIGTSGYLVCHIPGQCDF